jgi:hypothetical protein
MPATALRREAAVLFGYVCVACVFAWPLPLHLVDAMIGSPATDAGVYVWNLWVFRHEIVENHRLPFLTSEILALSPPVPLALHNYTTFANVLAFPLIPLLGIVRTFNLLVIGSGVMTAYAMYAYARKRTGDATAAWVGGLVFGFSPFMSARAGEHFSLTLAAPLPLFGWLMYRLYAQPTLALASAAGATVAWAFLCDVYYAVYCLLIAAWVAGYSIFSVERQTPTVRRIWPRALVDLATLCVAGLIVGIIVRGGGSVDVAGLRVSFTRLYTPVLVLTLLIVVRTWLTIRPKVVAVWPVASYTPAAIVSAVICIGILAPVLSASGSLFSESQWINPRILWRNSAPGVDLLAFFAPNPLNPIVGSLSANWLASLPGGFHENVASVPWVAMAAIVAAVVWFGFRPHRGWVTFTIMFAVFALGPFIAVAQYATYVPTPWAALRYLPIIGAARMPGRMTVLVMLGVAMLLAMALERLRSQSRHPRLVTAAVAGLLIIELLPAPRALDSARVPSVYHKIAEDPRDVRVLTLPFGLRDGMSGAGSFDVPAQFYQTVHGKRLIGGYVSRLPRRTLQRYRRHPVFGVLIDLSAGVEVSQQRRDEALQRADGTMMHLDVGYIIIDTARTPQDLQDFAREAFSLTLVTRDGTMELYRTPAAALPTPTASSR